MLLADIISKEPITKGWSHDKKFRVTTRDGDTYLLRVTPADKSAHRKEMFRMQQQVEALGVPMCKPVEYGQCDEGVYTIQTWIDGRDAEDIIPNLSKEEQYSYGLEAGRILKIDDSLYSSPEKSTGVGEAVQCKDK